MDNYRIIRDYPTLKSFVNWLPELEPHETYYISLLARNKYCKDISHIKTDVEQLKRFTTTREKMIDKIHQLECEVGAYTQGNIPIPQVALALYIHPNPRSQILAAKRTCRILLDKVLEPYSNYNVHQVALSNIQASRSRKIYFDIDYDKLPYESFLSEGIGKFINQEAVSVIKTHGGFHALIKLDIIHEDFSKVWYKGLNGLAKEDLAAVAGDLLMPVPGCTQGDFMPYFLMINGIEQ